MLRALTEVEARRQLKVLAHECGDTSFAPAMTRSHDERGLWLVFRGPCPRCNQDRELRFHAAAPLARLPPAPVPSRAIPPVRPYESTREEDDLYTQQIRCTSCDGAGQSLEVMGDYASTEMVRCFRCGGSGFMPG